MGLNEEDRDFEAQLIDNEPLLTVCKEERYCKMSYFVVIYKKIQIC